MDTTENTPIVEKKSLTEILTEIKHLEKWITETVGKLSERRLFAVAVTARKRLAGSETSTEEYSRTVQSLLDHIIHRVQRLERLRTALVRANAMTKVTLPNGAECTIIEAVKVRDTYKVMKHIRELATAQYNAVTREVANTNLNLDKNAQTQKLDFINKSKTGDGVTYTQEEIEVALTNIDMLTNANKVSLCSAPNLLRLVEDSDEIEDFDMRIDAVLSRANAMTEVEI